MMFVVAERYPSGPRGLTRNQLGVARRAWVRLPLFPPYIINHRYYAVYGYINANVYGTLYVNHVGGFFVWISAQSNGMDIISLMRIMGHANVSTT